MVPTLVAKGSSQFTPTHYTRRVHIRQQLSQATYDELPVSPLHASCAGGNFIDNVSRCPFQILGFAQQKTTR